MAEKSTRRSYLKTIGGSVTAATVFSASAGADSDRTEIVVVISGDGEKTTTFVPTDWWEYEQRVRDALHEARTQYGSQEGVQGFSRIVGRESIAGRLTTQLKLRASKAARKRLPDRIDGIPIKKTPPEQSSPDCISPRACKNDSHYSTMTGGIPMEGEDGRGTSCCRVTRNGSEYLLTVAHLWDNPDDDSDNCDTNFGQTACQYGPSVGDIWDMHIYRDWALIELNSDESIDSKIDNSGGGSETVYGHYTNGAVTTLMTETRPVWKQGCSTGNEKGYINETGYSTSYDCADFDSAVVTSCDTTDGDSGGPTYGKRYVPDDKVAIVGLHSGHKGGTKTGDTACSNNVYNKAIAVAGSKLHTDYGMNFGKGNTAD